MESSCLSSYDVSPRVPADPSSVTLGSWAFDDIDLQSRSVTGWNIEYAQTRRGRFAGSYRELLLPGLQLSLETNNVWLNQYGSGRADTIAFGMHMDVAGHGTLNGSEYSSSTLTGFKGERQHDALVPPSTMLMLTIDRAVLQDYMGTVEHVNTLGWLDKGHLVVDDDRVVVPIRTQLLSVLEACFDNAEATTTAQLRSDLLLDVLAMLAPVIADNLEPARPSVSAVGRADIVRRARSYIRSHIDAPIQIIDVCRALKVSRRMLQYSFQDLLAVNPATYLRVLRLNGARRDLRCTASGNGNLQIKDVVSRWGFWHLSRFSAEYRALFGELPSETLRCKRQVPLSTNAEPRPEAR